MTAATPPEIKTRITVIAEYFPPRLSADRRIFELVSRLPKNKYEFTFITLPPSYVLFISKMREKPPLSSVTAFQGIRGITIGYPQILLRLWEKSFIAAHALTLAYVLPKALLALLRASPRLIVVNNTSAYTGLVGSILSIVTRTRLFVDFNDLESEYTFEKVQNRVPTRLHGAIRTMLRTVEDIILRRSNGVVTVHTQFLKRYAERRHKKKILYVPDGVDTKVFTPAIVTRTEIDALKGKLGVANSKVCVYAGRIDWNIGGEILLKTIELLGEKETGIKCLVLGEGEPDLIEHMKKLTATVYVGLRPPSEVPKYLAMADVVLVPHPRTTASDSFSPVKLFEAFAMAKPVVASDLSGIRDALTNGLNGILANDNPEQWVQAIERIISNKELCERLSENAFATAAKYDWSLLSGNFQSAIEMALL